MKTRFIIKRMHFFLIMLLSLILFSCEKYEYCAECWENKPLLFSGDGDVSFCSDDLGLVDDFIYDYESWGWECKLRD